MIEQGTFDIGHPITRAQLEAFALAFPDMTSGINSLLAVAVKSVVININEVAQNLEAQ